MTTEEIETVEELHLALSLVERGIMPDGGLIDRLETVNVAPQEPEYGWTSWPETLFGCPRCEWEGDAPGDWTKHGMPVCPVCRHRGLVL